MRAMPNRLPLPPVPIAIAVVLTLLVAACDATESSPGTPEPIPTGDLAGTEWVLREIDGVETVATSRPSLAFEAGRVTGTTGCNSLGGEYAVDGSSIAFSPLATTKRACEPGLMDQEAAVLDALSGVTAWEIGQDGRLRLRGATELDFDPAAP